MEDDIGIRQFRDGDEIGILNLLKQSFGTWPRLDLEFSPLEHWVWKYKSNPYGKMNVFIFENNGEIIGCWHRVFSRIKIGEDEVLASMGADVAILPKLQGKGYSSKIREVMFKTAHEAGNYFVFGFTPNPILSKSAYRSGFSAFPYSIKEYVWVKDVNLFLRRRVKSWLKKWSGYYFLKTINKINNGIKIDSFTENLHNDMQIRAFDYFDEKILEFIQEVEVDYNFISNMNINYLNWRYCDERGGKYIKFRLFSGDKTLGIIILGIKRGEGFIANLLAKKEDTTVIYNLLKKALEVFESNSINVAHILVIKGHPYEKILKSCDFIDNRLERYIDYIFLDDNSKKIEPGAPSNILFQYGDTDWI